VTGANDAAAAEQRRLAAVPSIAEVAARHVDDLAELRAADLPEPLIRLGAPPGWRLANLQGSPVAPARVLVNGQHPDGSWDGCETIRVFGFSGALAVDVLRANADCTLRGLGAEHITAGALAAPPAAATAVRSSGSFTTAGRRVWAQFSTYVARPRSATRGMLIEHSLVVDSRRRATLNDDITNLSNGIHHAFLAAIEHRSDDVELFARWQALIENHSVSPRAAEIGASLLAAWAQPHRCYHTIAHLRDVLGHVDELAAHALDPDTVRLAAWYHDAVYRGAPDDEERSAQRAENDLGALQLAPGLIDEVARLVRLTASHNPVPGDRNGETLCDADLAILAAPAERYASYRAAVRAEYADVPQQSFATGRATILQALLDAPAVYRTPHARRHWETRARTNIRGELDQLRAPSQR
jgi:predicted metal-dependent HD superfamily phosphohydrolase